MPFKNFPSLNEGHVTLVARLELIEHVRENCVLVHKVHIVLVEPAHLLQGFVVIRIDKEQVASKQNVNNIRPFAFVDGYAGVALVFQLGDRLKVEDRLNGQHVAVVQMGHHVLDRLAFEDERSGHNVHLVFLQVRVLVRHLDEFHQTLPGLSQENGA